MKICHQIQIPDISSFLGEPKFIEATGGFGCRHVTQIWDDLMYWKLVFSSFHFNENGLDVRLVL